ncbi:hypothetical protein DB88DRAFT_304640 [Papiliotrema laurentii]|uniref:Cytochrome c oxidase assembly protein COX20, mitochondrial n=1 Tax=Papiliotrema laurentii TaxID=5418 RepID=A0AAD9CXX5_PAPLA|nr:hypothetical protein DB88DRAFT_304640 [Papiliotrema laurentii]
MSRPLNIPSGNSTITPDPGPLPEEERLTGDTWQDYKRAIKMINVKDDFQNLGQTPCVRTSLLYGIGGGIGLGAVRAFASGRIISASRWAVGSFAIISIVQMEVCRAARRKELRTMRAIQENFKHISSLERK